MDYTKKCWSCRHNTIHPVKTYYQCDRCGATWNDISRGGFQIFESSPTLQQCGKGRRMVKSMHPTPGLKRQIAKAREAASAKPKATD